MTQLERIEKKINKLRSLDPEFRLFGAESHNYKLRGKVEESDIIEFERNNNIELPKGYREFISKIGNGPCGPYYGLVSLSNCLLDDLDHPDKNILIDTTKPFIHNERWNLDFSDFDESEDEEYFNNKIEKEYFDPKWMNGTIKLSNYGCGITMNLVVNGKEHGHVWVDDRCNDQGIYPDPYSGNKKRVKFLDWYEYWLDHSIKEIHNEYTNPELNEIYQKNDKVSLWDRVKRMFN